MTSLSFKGFGYAKALIFGEYAVMDGHPGLAAALPIACQVSLNKSDTQFTDTQTHPSAFHASLKKLCAEITQQPFDIALCLDQFFDAHHKKLGIGSSAAAIVALNIAICQYLNKEIHIMDMIQMHRALQNNMGSGIDIIASYAGGCVLAQGCPHHPVIERISPDSLPCFAVYSLHTPAPTLKYIETAKRYHSDKRYQNVIASLGEIYITLAKHAKSANISAFLDAMANMPSQLRTLGDILQLPVWPDIMNEITDIAQNHHVIVKTSGAGGGDIILALAQKQAKLDGFSQELITRYPHISQIPSDTPPERGDLLL